MAVILLPIAALIGLTISQVVKSSAIRDDALQAQKDIENFLRVQEFVRRIQVTEMFCENSMWKPSIVDPEYCFWIEVGFETSDCKKIALYPYLILMVMFLQPIS